jgi:DNA-binding NtrC family response regulator
MQQPLLIIENPPPLISNYLNCDLLPDPSSRWELATWDSLPFEKLQRCNAQLVVAVAVPPVPEAIRLFKRLREHPIPSPTLAVLSNDVDDETLRAASQSSDDFILWPIHKEELRHRLQRMLGTESKRDELESAHNHLTEILGMEQLVGRHPKFIRAIKTIPLIAKSDLPVLITGATGTGKELCARAIHLLGKRRSFPFIPVDGGAIPDHLFENELFGHARGAFTDAHTSQKGLAAMAEGGTLFLDEIDALSPSAQAKLLRFLQERTYRPLGGERFIKATINVIAATNRNIEECVAQKRFRGDLYFRLNALRMDLPPLVERQSDIQLLARYCLRVQYSQPGSIKKAFLPASLRKLEHYDWPGNVRELFHVVQRASLFSEGQFILPRHISIPVPDPPHEEPANDFHHGRTMVIEAFEKHYVEQLLRKHEGNVTRAALEAGKDRRAFGRLKKKYRINF